MGTVFEEYGAYGSWRIQILGVAALVAVTLTAAVYLAAGPYYDEVNEVTRPDLSQHVSNKPCGMEYPDSKCPGRLQCHSGLYSAHRLDNISGFNTERVGANITESRCVTPTYEHRPCGLFESSGFFGSYRTPCYPLDSFSDRINALVAEGISYGFSTDGAELIRKHGLKLAKKEAKVDKAVSDFNISINYSQEEDELTINFVQSSFSRENTDSLLISARNPRFKPRNVVLRYNGSLYHTNHVAGTEESVLNFPLSGKQLTIVRDGINPGEEGNEGVYSPHGESFMTYHLAWSNEYVIDKPVVNFGYRNGTWEVK